MTPAMGNVHINFVFFYICVFIFQNPYGTDRQTERLTGKTRNAACVNNCVIKLRLKAKYSPRVAAVSRTQKNTKNPRDLNL